MKKNYFKLLLIVFFTSTLYSQTTPKFFGVCTNGAPEDQGIIYNIDTNGSNMTSLDSLSYNNEGRFPDFQRLVEANNGKIYGVTKNGGANDAGTLFEYNPTTGVKTIRHHFTSSTGESPKCSMIKASNGKLYGTTFSGGANNRGTFFEFNTTGNTYTVKANFNDSIRNPEGNLVQTTTGNIYGVIKNPGNSTYKDGCIFKFNLTTNAITAEGIFLDTVSGRYPTGLIIGSNGKMYGMTWYGGDNNYGKIFEFDPATNTLVGKASFNGTNGNPGNVNTLFEASNGKFYGTCYSGGSGAGTLFEYNKTTDSITRKHTFVYYGTYAYSRSSFIEPAPGTLMITFTGGENTYLGSVQRGRGSLAEYNISTNVLTPKHWFYNVATGASPSEVLKASNGKYYGITFSGGKGNNGTLFEYDRTLDTLIKKHDFTPKPEGSEFVGRMIKASNGKLYGVTRIGGAGYGTIYEFDPMTNKHTKLADFDRVNGDQPNQKLIQATNGKLYGTCRLGGQHYYGTLFEFDIATSLITVKKHFNYGTGFIGGRPYNAPYQASNGKIYGLYSQGLYAYDLALDSLMLVKNFVSNITGSPGNSSPIIQANDGNLYMSTTSGGKYNYGALVQYNFTLDSLIAIPVHAGVRGMQSQPMQASNGKLYIPTQSVKGICEYTLGTDTLIQKKIISTSRYFLNTQGRLIEANGKLYGTGHYYKSSLSYLYNYDLATDSLTMNRGVIKGYLIGGLTQAVSPTVGLDDEEKATSFGIKVYPNPTMDYIQFDLDRQINEIRIYNMRGQLVSQPSPNQNKVEVSTFENGTYIIQLFTDNGVAHSRFIKQ